MRRKLTSPVPRTRPAAPRARRGRISGTASARCGDSRTQTETAAEAVALIERFTSGAAWKWEVAIDAKDVLKRYLQVGRDALVWKLEGLDPYDARRPMVPTATNLLGLVKHTAGVEAGYLGQVFGRPFPDEPFPWLADDAEPNADMWATEDETLAGIVDLYRRVWEHSDATIDALDLRARGHVPWWGERGDVTLHLILVHVATETHRHAGHADILRELIDGSVGLRPQSTNVPELDREAWAAHRARVEAAARAHRADDGREP